MYEFAENWKNETAANRLSLSRRENSAKEDINDSLQEKRWIIF